MRDETSDNRRDADDARNTGASISLARLREAVARGVISDEQLRRLRDVPEPEAGVDGAAAAPAVEAPRGLNAVILAYYVGAAAVVFAFGWFIVDRWEALGAPGVLAVAVVYAAVFALSARTLARAGFETAAALATLLTVAMVPIVAWSLLKMAGLWYEPDPWLSGPYARRADVLEALRWIPLELATALAGLFALRRVRFGLLALPVAAAVPPVIGQAMLLVIDPEVGPEMLGWTALIAAAVMLACGYWVDRHPRDDEDYARWVYLVGLVALSVGVVASWQYMTYERHGLPALAAGLFAVSLFLRRPMFLVFGSLGFVGYLAYLAFDVFRTTLSFPIVLATFGLCVILLAVWAQRRYPALARRMEARQGGQRRVPHAALVFGGAIAISVVLFAVQLPEAHDRAREQWTRIRAAQLRAHARQRPAVSP